MNTLGTIRILEDKIIIEKEDKIEIWIKTNKISKEYISYNGNYYKLEGDLDDNIEIDEELENDI